MLIKPKVLKSTPQLEHSIPVQVVHRLSTYHFLIRHVLSPYCIFLTEMIATGRGQFREADFLRARLHHNRFIFLFYSYNGCLRC